MNVLRNGMNILMYVSHITVSGYGTYAPVNGLDLVLLTMNVFFKLRRYPLNSVAKGSVPISLKRCPRYYTKQAKKYEYECKIYVILEIIGEP